MSYNKTKAAQLREVAQMLDEDGFEKASGYLRSTADELDPPQPEWSEGDLVLDKVGAIRKKVSGGWYSLGTSRVMRTDDLTQVYGPLRRVYLADPAKSEVVVSIEGLDKSSLRRLAQSEEPDFATYSANSARAAVRAAKAAQAAGLLDEEK